LNKWISRVKALCGKMIEFCMPLEQLILIVYVPILALSGVAGKNVSSMAQTVMSPIFGGVNFITYLDVPMMSALDWVAKTEHKRKFFLIKLMDSFNVLPPILEACTARKKRFVLDAEDFCQFTLISFANMAVSLYPIGEEIFAVETEARFGSSMTDD